MTGHLFVFENPSRPLTQTVGTTPAVKHGSMRGWSSGKIPSLYHALKAFTFGFGYDVYELDVFEVFNRDDISLFVLMFVVATNLLCNLLRFDASFLGVAS